MRGSRGHFRGRGRGHHRGHSNFRGHGRGGQQGEKRYGDRDAHDGASRRGSGRPPRGLSGREIGMWYARRSKQQTKQREKTNLGMVQMDRRQLEMANHALREATDYSDVPEVEELPGCSSSFSGNEPRPSSLSNNNQYKWFASNGEENLKDSNFDRILAEELSNKSSPNYLKMLEFRKKLPAFKLEREVIDLVNSNQVVVLSGETGCGKTTQVPQFILNDAIMRGKGSTCKVICTQPRRISAISVAERVAKERDERCGQSCGYQIRLESKLPRQKASILYCTTGIIIRWLQSDPLLSRVSHIILDEIHECDLQTDFLITIVKSIVSARKDLKVILMSATLNADTFSSYFGDCPKINIPGFTYPVTEYYLEDAMKMTKYDPPDQVYGAFDRLQSQKLGRRAYSGMDRDERQAMKSDNLTYKNELQDYEQHLRTEFSKKLSYDICCMDAFLQKEIDFDFIVNIIKHVTLNPPAPECEGGSMLVFLPGWDDIKKLNNRLTDDRFFNPRRFRIIPLHSMMPTAQQQQVFDRPPSGVTKIVIATNIAETSITIDDVIYVIDSGKIKVRNFEHGKNINVLRPQWVTKANAKQRKGRAGRVQSGYCFHVFTKLQESKMEDYMIPEILRTPLDHLSLQVKFLQLGGIQKFLSQVLDPPAEESVGLSIQKLTALNALDHEERLTPLGYHLARLPVEPQIGKMLLFGAMFSCLEPILTVAACLSFKDPFVLPLGKEKEVNDRKLSLARDHNCDHLMFVNTFMQWQKAGRYGFKSANDFCFENFLSNSTLNMVKNMRTQFTDYLNESGFISTDTFSHSDMNRFSDNPKIVQAVICSGLYPNVAKLIKKKPFRKPTVRTRTEKVYIHPKSVNCEKMSQEFSQQWLCYYEKMKTADVYLYDTIEASVYPLLFFGGDIKPYTDEEGDNMISVDDWIVFKARPDIAQTVEKLRKELDKILEKKIKEPHSNFWHEECAEKSILNTIINLISSE